MDVDVLAAPEEQRGRALAVGLHVADAADDDLVVTAGQRVLDGALDDRDHVREPGGTGWPALVADLVPGGRQPPAGEVGGQVPLPVAEHVDRERPVAPDGLERRALEVEADEHQGRLKRQRRDRVRGRPDRLAVRPNRGHDRDPGCEVTHRLAQPVRGDPRRVHVGDVAGSVVNSGHDLRLSIGKGKHGLQHKNPYVMIFPWRSPRPRSRAALPVELGAARTVGAGPHVQTVTRIEPCQ